jgi:hypothetical protein
VILVSVSVLEDSIMVFAQEQESGASKDILTALEQFVINAIHGGALEPIVILALVAGLFAYFYYRRERLLRHQERMAMIQAGIHPDYPPEIPPPAAQTGGSPASKETTDFRPM